MSCREAFAEVLSRSAVPLGEGCFVIACHLGHPVSVASGIAMLDALADAGPDGDRSLDAIGHHVCTTLGYRGDRATYHDPRNSMLPDVIRRRRGIPITLAILVIEVAARLDVDATGVGMPGHFLVGDGPTPTRWLDPFHDGAWLDVHDARHLFRSLHGERATFDPVYLRPTPAAQILGRVLANLAAVHRGRGDPNALARTLELRGDIDGIGTTARARVELADALAGVGRVGDAIVILGDLADELEPRRRSALGERIRRLRAGMN